MSFQLSICLFVTSSTLRQSLQTLLSGDRYDIIKSTSIAELADLVEKQKEKIDCLVLDNNSSLQPVFNCLYEQGILLPLVLLEDKETTTIPGQQPLQTKSSSPSNSLNNLTCLYHGAEVRLRVSQVEKISTAIDRAIAQFLRLAPSSPFPQPQNNSVAPNPENSQAFLILQQRRLAEKLQERLGYLGIYYKRDPQRFFRNLSRSEKDELLEDLAQDYRDIILRYFSKDSTLNQSIDQFVNRAFFADLSVSRILEIHMELMDEFAQQLQLEGRSEEILIDYRLALIDIIAHLGEMYRRSIPREDLPLGILTHSDWQT